MQTVQVQGSVMPTERSACSMVHYNDKLFVFGGQGKFRYNDLFAFDLQTSTWEEIIPKNSTSVPSKRCKHSAIVYKNYMYIFGGWDSAGKLNDLHRFDFVSQSWEPVPSVNAAPAPRSAHSALLFNDSQMIVFGGIGQNKYSDMYSFDLEKRVWKSMHSATSIAKRSSYGDLLLHPNSNSILVCGGLTCGQLNDVVQYDGKQWQVLAPQNAPNAPCKRGRHASCMYNNSIHVFGGWTGKTKCLNDLYQYDISGNTWTKLQTTVATPAMSCHASVLVNNKWYIFGGWDDQNTWYNSLYVLHLQ